MKKYSVFVEFKNGQSIQFDTDSNVKLIEPIMINEQPMIITENDYAINLRHVVHIKQELNGHLQS